MSRNKDRSGFEDESTFFNEDPPPAAVIPKKEDAASGGGFSWSAPTQFVDLPSGGEFYPEKHPLHKKETVEIKFMTAKEEDILTSRSLLKEGVAIDRLLQSVLVNKDINVNSLLVGDKNALIVAARVTGYGPEYETKVTCPSCSETENFSFDLTGGEKKDINSTLVEYGAAKTEENTFIVQVPLTEANVEVRLLTGADEMKTFKESQRKAKRKLDQTTLTDQFKSFIVSVNGDNTPLTVRSFIQAMPARDSRHLRIFYSDITPNVDLSQIYECSSCGYSADMEVPLTADFFWPK